MQLLRWNKGLLWLTVCLCLFSVSSGYADSSSWVLKKDLIRKILQPYAATTFLGVERSQWQRPTAVVARYPSETAG